MAYQEKFKLIKDDISENRTNILNSTLDLISTTLDYQQDKSPKLVIEYSLHYYPHIANLDFDYLDIRVSKAGEELVNYPKKIFGSRLFNQKLLHGHFRS